jgi:hypothetical protein
MRIRNLTHTALTILLIGFASIQAQARPELIAENCRNERLGKNFDITYKPYENADGGTLRLLMTESMSAPVVTYESIRNKEVITRPNPSIVYKRVYGLNNYGRTMNPKIYLVFGTKNEIHFSFVRPRNREAPDSVFRQENNFVCERYFLYPQN